MLNPSDILQASILIVDDQEANVKLLQRLLGDSGYTHITSTLRPQDVAALHREHRYDLILLDLQMPGMDGFEVMQGLTADAADGYLPVIVLTAQPGHKLRALQAGAKDFISKPFDLAEVRTRIRNLLEVRLLYKTLERHNEALELAVQARTAELRDSESRFRRLTALASDWYWEQNETGEFTHVSGPIVKTLGLGMAAFLGETSDVQTTGWDPAAREALKAKLAARQPFLHFAFSRITADGSTQKFQVSGEPMFDTSNRFTGYRGIGVQVAAHASDAPPT